MVAASLTLSDGRVLRFGPDEEDPGDVPTSISFDTTNPGGFGSATIRLPRPSDLDLDDAKLFSDVVLYGDGGRVLYEGFVVGVPAVGRDEIELQLSGWVSVLDRVQTFREIFVDRDLNKWTGPSHSRRLLRLAFNGQVREPSVETDSTTGSPSLRFLVTDSSTAVYCEGLYDAGTNRIAKVYYSYRSDASAASQPNSAFVFKILTATEDYTLSGGSTTGDLHTSTAATASGYLDSTSTPAQYAAVEWSYAGALGNVQYEASITPLAVYGDHGLTLRGSDPGGVYASDVIGYIIGQAPGITSPGDSVEATTFVIPHLVFDEDVSLRAAIEQVTALGGESGVANDWGVYEGREFYWRSPGTYGRTWHVRRDQVAETSADGPDADSRVAGVKVNYTDSAGTAKSVGPPGSNSDTETTDLLDSDPDNPAHRIPGAFVSESVGITTEQGAKNIGVLILNERNRLDWRGSVSITGSATDSNGNRFPTALVRAGDRIVVEDAADTSERTIVSTSYNHDSLTVDCEIGAPPDTLESLLGRLALVTDLIG